MNNEQVAAITNYLRLSDGADLSEALKELGLDELDPNTVEKELNEFDFGYCLNCGEWKDGVADDWCEDCRNEMEF